MPVNYTPQFIPTNTAALQGTLNEYQKAYDTETARQNQATDTYNALPTTNNVDAIAKESLMSDFQQNKLAALDKKYNYDRANSMYAQELAKEIGNLRSNPLWSVMQQKEEIGKMRQQLMATRGPDYVENFNPLDVSVKDRALLAEWKPTDVDAIRKTAAIRGKAMSENINNYNLFKRADAPGMLFAKESTGYKDVNAAIAYVESEEGDAELRKTIISAGGDPSNPIVFNAAKEAMVSSMVGKESIREWADPSYVRGGGPNDNTISGLEETGTKSPITTPYAVTSISDAYTLNDDIVKTKKQLESTTDAGQRAQLELILNNQEIEKDRVNAQISMIEAIPENQSIISTGKDSINKELDKYKTFIAGDKAPEIYDALLPYFIKTNPRQRSSLLTPFSDTDKSSMIPVINNILKTYTDTSNPVDVNFLGSVSMDIINNFEDFYKGKGDFSKGYVDIENQVDKVFSTGDQPKFKEYTLPMATKPTDRSRITDHLVEVVDSMLPTNKSFRAGDTWKKGKAEEVKATLSTPGTTANYLFDNEDKVYIRLSNPGDNKKNKAISETFVAPYSVLYSLYNETGDDRFLNERFSLFNIAPNKEYNISTKGGVINTQLKRYFPDISLFNGFRIKKKETPDGAVSYELYTDKDDNSPNIYQNKGDLLKVLTQLYVEEKGSL